MDAQAFNYFKESLCQHSNGPNLTLEPLIPLVCSQQMRLKKLETDIPARQFH
jgi:hypothetical protein